MKTQYIVFSLLLLLGNTHYSRAMEEFSQSNNKGEYEERDTQYDDADSIELHGLSEKDKAIFGVCYSPNNRYFASGAEDGTIKIWEATTRKLIKTIIIKEKYAVQSVCFSPDSCSLAAGLEYGDVLIYNINKDALQSVCFGSNSPSQATELDVLIYSYTAIANKHSATSVCFSNDNKFLIVGRSSGEISLYDAKIAREHGAWLEIYTLTHGDECVMEVCCSPADSTVFASCSDDGMIKVWDLQNKSLLRTLDGHTESVSSISFSPNGQRLVSGSEDKTVRIWDWEKSTCLHTLSGFTEQVSSVQYSQNGAFIAYSSDKTITIRNSTTMEEVKSFSYRHRVNQLTWRADGMQLLAGLGYGIIDIRNTSGVTILKDVEKIFQQTKDVSTQKDLLLNLLVSSFPPAVRLFININLPSSILWNHPQPE